MVTETFTLVFEARDRMSKIAQFTGNTLKENKVAAQALGDQFEKLGGEAGKLADQTGKLADAVLVQKAEFKDYSAKLDDANKRLGEFGASQAQLGQALTQTIALSEKYNVNLGRSGEVLEELALQTQDPIKALKLQEQALQVMIKTNRRADESAEDVARALIGETTVLKELSPRGERYAKLLDKIGDRQKRAAETVRLMGKELKDTASPIDTFNDNLTLARVRASEMAGGIDILGIGAKAGAGALLALGAGIAAATAKVISFGIESSKTFLEATPRGRAQLDDLNQSVNRFSFSMAKAIDGNVGLNETTSTMTGLMNLASSEVRTLGAQLQPVTGFVLDFAEGFTTANLGLQKGAGLLSAFTLALQGASRDLVKARDLVNANAKAQREFQSGLRTTASETENTREIKRIQAKISLGKELLNQTERQFVAERGGERGSFFAPAFEDRAKAAKKLTEQLDKEDKKRTSAGIASTKKRLKAKEDGEISFGIKEVAFQEKAFERAKKLRLREEAELRKSDIDRIDRITQQAFKEIDIEQEKLRLLEGVRTGRLQEADPGISEAERRAAKALEGAEGLTPDQAIAKIKDIQDSSSELTKSIRKSLESMGSESKALLSAVSGAAVQASTAVGSGIASMTEDMAAGTFNIKKFGASILGGIGDIMVSAGSNLLLAGTLGLQPELVVGGLALMAAGGALKGGATRAAGGSSASASTAGSGSNSQRNAAQKQERKTEALEAKGIDTERERRVHFREEAKQQALEDARNEDFRRSTFLEAVDRVLVEDRRRDRDERRIFQTFEGLQLRSPSAAPTAQNQATQTRLAITQLARTNQLPQLSGNTAGLVPA